jgi:HEPN domain-containing protein
MTRGREQELRYIIWQNRAFDFYIAARLLHQQEQHRTTAYCAAQSIEVLLKATLGYWIATFNPRDVSHRIAEMLRMLGDNVPHAERFRLPAYFYSEKASYYFLSRYPDKGKGFIVPGTILSDLDVAFCQLIELVPFQSANSMLGKALRGRDTQALAILRRRNPGMRRLRKHLAIGSIRGAP